MGELGNTSFTVLHVKKLRLESEFKSTLEISDTAVNPIELMYWRIHQPRQAIAMTKDLGRDFKSKSHSACVVLAKQRQETLGP